MARKLEDFLTTALQGFEKGYGSEEASSLERELLKGKIKSNLEQKEFKRNIELLKGQGFNVVPSGVDVRGNVKYKIEDPSKVKGTFKERFNRDLRRARSGEITWDDLREKYPTELDDIMELQSKSTPIRKSPLFKKGKGWEALTSPHIAKINPATDYAISQIKNELDYKEFLDDAVRGEFKESNVDVNAIKEWFGRR